MKEFNSLSRDQVKALTDLLAQVSNDAKITQKQLKKKVDLLKEFLPYSSVTILLYELPFNLHLTIALMVMGLDEHFVQAAKDDDPAQAVIDLARSDESLPEPDSELDDTESKALRFLVIESLAKNVDCIQVYGKALNDLVSEVRLGHTKSLFNAVRIDRSIVGSPAINQRIKLAEQVSDRAFFKRLSNALKGRPSKQRPRYDALRYLVRIFEDAGLQSFSDDQLDFFIQDLDLYPDDGDDPIRSLRQLIYRFRKAYST